MRYKKEDINIKIAGTKYGKNTLKNTMDASPA
jgi:hypothetical protein